ncbi:MAG: ABC transporter ATP-binding protein [Alphaproteobacteria bacterium]|nr:ABC transporter ATP-binding protein [Alphaproteobacteria bacterium]
MTLPALAFEGVGFAYNGKFVLDGVDFAVPAGEVTALMGPSGCGKSTLVALAAGLLQPRSGQVRRSHRRAAVMFQDPLLLPWRTARDNVGFALKAERLDRAERLGRAGSMLTQVGLGAEDAGKYPRQLSGGMRQRVALARALVVDPDLLLLDEPFNGLDTALADRMLALVRDLVERRGVTALVITHDPRQAARFAETVHILSPAPAQVVASRPLAAGGDVVRDAEAILADLARLDAARE